MTPQKMANKILVERTNLRTLLIAILVAFVGLILLAGSAINGWWVWIGNQSAEGVVESVVRDIGSLLLATVALSLLWELVGKRAFLDELLPKVGLSEDIVSAGIIGIKRSIYSDIHWDELLRNCNELDILCIDGATWYHTHYAELRKAAKHLRIRLILADPSDTTTLSELSRHLKRSKDYIKERIEETVESYKRLQDKGATVNIWYLQTLPLFSFYRFDHTIVFELYSHLQDENHYHGPVFLIEKGGGLYDFIQRELDTMVQGTLAKSIP